MIHDDPLLPHSAAAVQSGGGGGGSTAGGPRFPMSDVDLLGQGQGGAGAGREAQTAAAEAATGAAGAVEIAPAHQAAAAGAEAGAEEAEKAGGLDDWGFGDSQVVARSVAGAATGGGGSAVAGSRSRGEQGPSSRGGWMDLDDWSAEISTSIASTQSQDQQQEQRGSAGGEEEQEGTEGAQEEGGRQDEERRHTMIRGFRERTGALQQFSVGRSQRGFNKRSEACTISLLQVVTELPVFARVRLP